MNLELAERNMSALMHLRAGFAKTKPFKNIRIGMALHVTKETGILVRTLVAGGAKVAITSCNPLSTQDDIVAALSAEGIEVYGYKGESKADYYRFIGKVIASKPQITIDDGCDLVTEIHTHHPELIKNIIGGCEETTTGVIRLRAMEQEKALKYPMIAVNDNDTKHLMDNYYGTGQSTLDGLMRAANMLFAGKTVVVAGYGDCGKGVALRVRGLGARVIVTEVQPLRALQAHMDGHMVMPMSDAAALGDIFITVTGNCEVIRSEHFKLMKSGAILANSGHFDVEIDLPALQKMSTKKRRIRPFLDEYTLPAPTRSPSTLNRQSSFAKTARTPAQSATSYSLPATKVIYVAGEGRLVNLAAAEGHPSEVMSMSFCGQALAVEYLLQNKGKLSAHVYQLPKILDEKIASLQLLANGISMDKLTPRQKKYLAGWQEGT